MSKPSAKRHESDPAASICSYGSVRQNDKKRRLSVSRKRQFLFDIFFLWKAAALQQHARQTWFKIIVKNKDQALKWNRAIRAEKIY